MTPALSDRLRVETAGNPLYATHLVRHWAESGRLVVAPEVRLLAEVDPEADGHVHAQEVPASLRNLLWSRVSALGDEVLEVLSTMRFVHVLVANAVYSELPGRRRRRLHARAAEVLQKRSDGPVRYLAALLACQCALGGLPAEAQRWATLAGDHAAAQLSPAEAARWYRTALDHAATLDLTDRERAELLARLGHAQRQANDPAAVETLTEAATLARRCGASSIVVQAALAIDREFLRHGPVAPAQLAIIESALELVDQDMTTRARLLALLAEGLVSEVDDTRRTDLAMEAVALADAGSDPTVLARICSSVLYALWGPGRAATELRADVARRSIDASRDAGDPDLEFSVHAGAYTVAIQLADPDGAARSLERLHAIADAIRAPHVTWTMGCYEAFVAIMEARFADAERLASDTLAVGLALGGEDGVTLFAGQAAVLATIAGRRSELPPIVTQAIQSGPAQLTFHLAHAIVSVANGPRKAATDFLDEAVEAGFTHVAPDVMWMTTMLGSPASTPSRVTVLSSDLGLRSGD